MNAPPLVHSTSIFGKAKEYYGNQKETLGLCRAQLGDTFTLPLHFGKKYTFVFRREDVARLYKQPESKASFVLSARKEYGFLLPKNPSSHEDFNMMALLTSALKPARLRLLSPVLHNVVRTAFSRLPQSGELHVIPWMKELVEDMILTSTFGERRMEDQEWAKEFRTVLVQASPENLIEESALTVFRALLESRVFGERSVYKKSRGLLLPVVHAAIDEALTYGYPYEREDSYDALSLFVAHRCREYDGDVQKLHDGADIRIANDMFTIMYAAMGNTANSAVWHFYYSVTNSSYRDEFSKMRSSGVFNDTLQPSSTSRNILFEVMRLYNSNIALRILQQDFDTSDGYTIPAGSTVAIPSNVLMLDEEYFADPFTFSPERHSQDSQASGSVKKKLEGNKSMFMGFGMGTHVCPGRKLAVIELELIVSAALERFEFKQIQPKNGQIPKFRTDQAALITLPSEEIVLSYTAKSETATAGGM
eukprot:CFRG7477T1